MCVVSSYGPPDISLLSYDSHNHYNCKSFDRHNHQICAVFRAESNASHFEMPCHSYCISISFPCLHYAQSTTWTTFFNANVPKNLGRGLPLPPHPQIDPIYTVCEKWTKNLGRALPPLNWTKSKRTATFFGRPSPREPSVLIISSHPIFCARFLNHWTIMHAILFLIFSAAQFWTLSDVWRWATENFTTFGNWKRATEIARKFKKMSNGEFCNFGALKKSCGD